MQTLGVRGNSPRVEALFACFQVNAEEREVSRLAGVIRAVVSVKRANERPQRWAFEMSYEFWLPASHRLHSSAAPAAVPRRSAALSRQDW